MTTPLHELAYKIKDAEGGLRVAEDAVAEARAERDSAIDQLRLAINNLGDAPLLDDEQTLVVAKILRGEAI